MPYYPPASSGSGYSTIEDEGVALTQRTTIDFVGSGVTASDVGGETRVTISGGGGGATATVVEVDLGSTPTFAGKFTITDAAITTTSNVLVWQSHGPYTGKGTQSDEGTMDMIHCLAIPGSGSAVVHWETAPRQSPMWDKPVGNISRASVSALAPPQDDPQARLYVGRRGLVKGNVKFAYVVF
jgi:hypothetical protein